MRIAVSGNGNVVQDVVTAGGDSGLGSFSETTTNTSNTKLGLESKYPGVLFKGDCSKIHVGNDVILKEGVTVEQNGQSKIIILGNTTVHEGAYISSTLSSVVINDSNIGKNAEIVGANIELINMTLSDDCKVKGGRGTISIKGFSVTNDVICSDSGLISIG